MSGKLSIVGLGPGDDRYLTREALDALAKAEALYGYGPYLDRVPSRKANRGMLPTIARKRHAPAPR
jgi:precorrin-3B C17-methyltransferase